MRVTPARWPLRLAAVAVAALPLGLAWMLIVVAGSGGGDDGPLIVDVISSPSLRKHAVVVRRVYTGAPTQTGIWIVAGDRPDADGPPPSGAPVALWNAGVARIGWRGEALRLIGDQEGVARDAGTGEGCLRTPAAPPTGQRPAAAWQLCLDPRHVSFVAMPR